MFPRAYKTKFIVLAFLSCVSFSCFNVLLAHTSHDYKQRYAKLTQGRSSNNLEKLHDYAHLFEDISLDEELSQKEKGELANTVYPALKKLADLELEKLSHTPESTLAKDHLTALLSEAQKRYASLSTHRPSRFWHFFQKRKNIIRLLAISSLAALGYAIHTNNFFRFSKKSSEKPIPKTPSISPLIPPAGQPTQSPQPSTILPQNSSTTATPLPLTNPLQQAHDPEEGEKTEVLTNLVNKVRYGSDSLGRWNTFKSDLQDFNDDKKEAVAALRKALNVNDDTEEKFGTPSTDHLVKKSLPELKAITANLETLIQAKKDIIERKAALKGELYNPLSKIQFLFYSEPSYNGYDDDYYDDDDDGVSCDKDDIQYFNEAEKQAFEDVCKAFGIGDSSSVNITNYSSMFSLDKLDKKALPELEALKKNLNTVVQAKRSAIQRKKEAYARQKREKNEQLSLQRELEDHLALNPRSLSRDNLDAWGTFSEDYASFTEEEKSAVNHIRNAMEITPPTDGSFGKPYTLVFSQKTLQELKDFKANLERVLQAKKRVPDERKKKIDALLTGPNTLGLLAVWNTLQDDIEFFDVPSKEAVDSLKQIFGHFNIDFHQFLEKQSISTLDTIARHFTIIQKARTDLSKKRDTFWMNAEFQDILAWLRNSEAIQSLKEVAQFMPQELQQTLKDIEKQCENIQYNGKAFPHINYENMLRVANSLSFKALPVFSKNLITLRKTSEKIKADQESIHKKIYSTYQTLLNFFNQSFLQDELEHALLEKQEKEALEKLLKLTYSKKENHGYLLSITAKRYSPTELEGILKELEVLKNVPQKIEKARTQEADRILHDKNVWGKFKIWMGELLQKNKDLITFMDTEQEKAAHNHIFLDEYNNVISMSGKIQRLNNLGHDISSFFNLSTSEPKLSAQPEVLSFWRTSIESSSLKHLKKIDDALKIMLDAKMRHEKTEKAIEGILDKLYQQLPTAAQARRKSYDDKSFCNDIASSLASVSSERCSKEFSSHVCSCFKEYEPMLADLEKALQAVFPNKYPDKQIVNSILTTAHTIHQHLKADTLTKAINDSINKLYQQLPPAAQAKKKPYNANTLYKDIANSLETICVHDSTCSCAEKYEKALSDFEKTLQNLSPGTIQKVSILDTINSDHLYSRRYTILSASTPIIKDLIKEGSHKKDVFQLVELLIVRSLWFEKMDEPFKVKITERLQAISPEARPDISEIYQKAFTAILNQIVKPSKSYRPYLENRLKEVFDFISQTTQKLSKTAVLANTPASKQ